MSESIPGEDSTLARRLEFAIEAERHRGSTAVENALMLKYPERFKHRGFISSYITGRRGKGFPDPKLLKLIADFLHVNFEWLVLGSGPMRRDGRGQTPFEMAMFTARDWGMREDGIKLAWEQNKEGADKMTAEHAFEEIQAACAHLERQGIPRPEAVTAVKDAQRSIERVKAKKRRMKTDTTPPPAVVVARVVGAK
jgi:hypothetical protein